MNTWENYFAQLLQRTVLIFVDYKIKQKVNTDNYCTSFNVKVAFLPQLY